MLEAWENAEEVWYPFVWEEQKDASDVIDYNIREEQTIDSSSVLNANNNTTTGMATVIPWINAPKLIANTSIIWDLWGWWEISRAIIAIHVDKYYQPAAAQITSWITIYNQWAAEFIDESWTIKVWRAWIYNMRLQVWALHSNQYFSKTVWVNLNWTTIISSTSTLPWTDIQDTVVSLSKWDLLTLYISNTTQGWVPMQWDISISFM